MADLQSKIHAEPHDDTNASSRGSDHGAADHRPRGATSPRHQAIDGNVTLLIQPGKSAGSPSGEKDHPCFATSW